MISTGTQRPLDTRNPSARNRIVTTAALTRVNLLACFMGSCAPAHQHDVDPALVLHPAVHLIPISEHLENVRLTRARRRREPAGMQLRQHNTKHADQAIAIDQQRFDEWLRKRWTRSVGRDALTHWTILLTASLSASGPSTS